MTMGLLLVLSAVLWALNIGVCSVLYALWRDGR